MEHRPQVGGYVAYDLLLPHVVALVDGSAYDGVQGRHHRTAVLAGKGKNRREREVDVDDALLRCSAAEKLFRQMEDVVLLRDILALGLSQCASLEDMLVAWESVHAVSSKLTVIIGVTIERQDGMEEGADRPHVAKPVEHMEREAALAVGSIQHEPLGIFNEVPRLVVLTNHRDLFHLGGIHEESPPHDDRACPEITVYPQRTQHCRPQLFGAYALRQFTFRLYHRGPLAGAAPVECLIKKE